MALPSLMLDRVDEARLLLAESWRTSLPSYSNLTPCIPYLALPADRVRDNTATGQIGRLKTSLCGRELPRTPYVADRWDVAYLLDDLRPKLPPEGHAAPMARDAGDVDDAAGLLREHRGIDMLHAEENAPDVGGHDRSNVAMSMSARPTIGRLAPALLTRQSIRSKRVIAWATRRSRPARVAVETDPFAGDWIRPGLRERARVYNREGAGRRLLLDGR